MFAYDFALKRTKFVQEKSGLFFTRRLPVPAIVALDGTDAFCRDGMRKDDYRLLVDGICLKTRGRDLCDIVAVYFQDVPTERFILITEGLERHDGLGVSVDLYVVPINDTCEIRELIRTCEHRCFPCIAAIVLTIGESTIHAEFFTIHARGIRDARRLRQTTS